MCRTVGVLLAVVILVPGLSAGETETYVNGVEGIKAASAPPPGVYWRNYNLCYRATELKDDDGDNVHIGFRTNVLASVHRGIWMTDRIKDVIGANFGMHVIVPVVHSDVKLSRLGVDDDRTRIGDIDFTPVILSWHKKRYDLILAYGVTFPTGDSHQADEAATLGKEHYTHMLSFGGTGYLDKAREWSFSLLARYEVHSEKKNRNYTAGQDFHFEWGLGKSFKQGFEVGLAGYCQWQTTKDQGSGVTWDRGVRDRVFAAGVEGNYFIKPVGLTVDLRLLKEFGAVDRPEGMIGTLTLTKRF